MQEAGRVIKNRTGVNGTRRHKHHAWLLLDEAQESKWDTYFWAAFFKSLKGNGIGPRVVIFSTYGLPSRG